MKKYQRKEETLALLQDFMDTEKEFGELLTETWDVIAEQPHLHAKVMKTAWRLRDLRVILQNNGVLSRKVN